MKFIYNARLRAMQKNSFRTIQLIVVNLKLWDFQKNLLFDCSEKMKEKNKFGFSCRLRFKWSITIDCFVHQEIFFFCEPFHSLHCWNIFFFKMQYHCESILSLMWTNFRRRIFYYFSHRFQIDWIDSVLKFVPAHGVG